MEMYCHELASWQEGARKRSYLLLHLIRIQQERAADCPLECDVSMHNWCDPASKKNQE